MTILNLNRLRRTSAALACAVFLTGYAHANEHTEPNPNSKIDFDVLQINWDAECTSLTIESATNMAGNEKGISNVVLACAEEGQWGKWEFDDDNPYVLGESLPGTYAPTEGAVCPGAIATAYVKAGSYKSGKGLPGVDPSEFNGHVGYPVDCTITEPGA